MAEKLGLMFAGQGAQTPGMGADLAEKSSAAREVFERADKILGWKVSDACFNGPASKLTESKVCQPAIYTMSIACLEALKERTGAAPFACGGLSLGEFAAATAAGVFDFEAGLRLVAKRGELMQEACRNSDGVMAAVMNAGENLVETVCSTHGVDVANLNCPGQIVISGDRGRLHRAISALKQEGVSRVIPLEVDGAFHSRLMKPAANRFKNLLAEVELSPPKCIFVQNYTGGRVDDPDEIRENLARQVTGSVRWESCVRSMISAGVDTLVEVGPGRVLTGFMRRIERRFPVSNVGNLEELNAVAEKISS